MDSLRATDEYRLSFPHFPQLSTNFSPATLMQPKHMKRALSTLSTRLLRVLESFLTFQHDDSFGHESREMV